MKAARTCRKESIDFCLFSIHEAQRGGGSVALGHRVAWGVGQHLSYLRSRRCREEALCSKGGAEIKEQPITRHDLKTTTLLRFMGFHYRS